MVATIIIDVMIKLKTVVSPYDISRCSASRFLSVFAKCTAIPKIVSENMTKNKNWLIAIISSSLKSQKLYICTYLESYCFLEGILNLSVCSVRISVSFLIYLICERVKKISLIKFVTEPVGTLPIGVES